MRTPHLPRGLSLPRVPRPHLPSASAGKAVGAGALVVLVAASVTVVGLSGGSATRDEPQTAALAAVDPMPAVVPETEPIELDPAPQPTITAVSVTPTPSEVAAVPLAPLAARTPPDVVITGATSFTEKSVTAMAQLAKGGKAVAFRAGRVTVNGKSVPTAGVNAAQFRQFAAKGTAEATAVWQAVARGEVVASHEAAKVLGLTLGDTLDLMPTGGGPVVPARLGALATTGLPSTDLVLDESLADDLRLPTATGLILATGKGGDPIKLANQVRQITGGGATVDLLAQPVGNPTAFLTGGAAARAFGAFSYRYFADGSIAPDDEWVRNNIRSEVMPIVGRVTCHRLMLGQLRGALEEVVARGLGDKISIHNGCYVPRFIASDPGRPISLHTWGIAIDFDAATNYRGIRGTMDIGVVEIFKRWGFRWGGDWNYTDPMHFEMGAILQK